MLPPRPLLAALRSALVGFLLAGLASAASGQKGSICTGDCDGNAMVTVDELLIVVNMALGDVALSVCPAADRDNSGVIAAEEISAAVANALLGCPALRAAIQFDQPREPINVALIGTGGTAPLPADNALLKAAVGPPWMRLDVGFEDAGCPDQPSAGPLYHPEDNSFDYCRLDQRLGQARAAGTTPLLIIDYTPLALVDPACAATNGRGLGSQHCPPNDNAKYGALVEAMIGHVYSAFGVTDFEVWNEPDWVYFAGTLDQYLQIYETCNAAMLRAEQRLALPPGTLHLGGPAAASADRRWINALLAAAVANPALRVDFISWHLYANNLLAGQLPDPQLYAGTYADATARVRGWVSPFRAQRADLHPALWIDEWNVNALFDVRMDTAYEAAFMAAALHAMQDAGLDRAARFNTWDSNPASREGFNGNWGLFTNDGGVRPGLYAFALWHQLAPIRVETELLGDAAALARAASTHSRYSQNLLASFDPPSGRATILLYNFVPYSPPLDCGTRSGVRVTLDLHGLAERRYQVRQQQVDCSTPIQPVATASLATTQSSLAVTQEGATVQVDLPDDSVVLVSLTPS